MAKTTKKDRIKAQSKLETLDGMSAKDKKIIRDNINKAARDRDEAVKAVFRRWRALRRRWKPTPTDAGKNKPKKPPKSSNVTFTPEYPGRGKGKNVTLPDKMRNVTKANVTFKPDKGRTLPDSIKDAARRKKK